MNSRACHRQLAPGRGPVSIRHRRASACILLYLRKTLLAEVSTDPRGQPAAVASPDRPVSTMATILRCAPSDRLCGTVGTRVPVQTITDNYDGGMAPAEIAEQWRLNIADVIAILEYRERLCPGIAG